LNLKELSKKICCDARLEAENNGQIFKFDPSGRLPRIWADEERLMQILLNLLNNAFRYTPKGGRIGFSVRAGDEKVFFAVSDTGPGLDAEQLKQVFEPYRIIQERGRRIRGLGLGLPLARMLARLHGGTIAAKSRVGKGSIFTLVMPLQARVRTTKTRPRA
jgi:signal transduction histidine kinase